MMSLAHSHWCGLGSNAAGALARRARAAPAAATSAAAARVPLPPRTPSSSSRPRVMPAAASPATTTTTVTVAAEAQSTRDGAISSPSSGGKSKRQQTDAAQQHDGASKRDDPQQQQQGKQQRGKQQPQGKQQQRGAGRQQRDDPSEQTEQRRRERERARRAKQAREQAFLDAAVVRVSEGSSVAGAAGCLCKFLTSGEHALVRLVAADDAALAKAALVLTVANTMAKQDAGVMLSFQPTPIGRRAADPPLIPEGSTAFYAAAIPAGDVLTDNALVATARADAGALARAIAARVLTAGHTVVECYGAAAAGRAMQAVATARKGLLARWRDVAVVVASAYEPAGGGGGGKGGGGKRGAQQEEEVQEAADDSSSGDNAKGSSGKGSGKGGAGERVLAYRLIVLECAPRDPSLLRVRSTYGKAG